jgi:hypothetical protein
MAVDTTRLALRGARVVTATRNKWLPVSRGAPGTPAMGVAHSNRRPTPRPAAPGAEPKVLSGADVHQQAATQTGRDAANLVKESKRS